MSDLIREGNVRIENQIEILLPTPVVKTGQKHFALYEILLSMPDGKMCKLSVPLIDSSADQPQTELKTLMVS
jgi:hypothetical protein